MMRRILTLAALIACPTAASAQTLFATRGLGTPIAPTDARSAALGSIGTGLLGYNLSLINPADASGLLRRGASATLQPSWNRIELGDNDESLGGSRFPLVRVVYPVNPRLVASLAYGAYLDQSWGVRFAGTEVLGNDTLTTSDVVESLGGVAQLRFGFSYAVGDRLSLGIGAGMLSGSLDRSVKRTFGEDSTKFEPFESRLRWSYKAPQLSVGARWDPTSSVRVAASMTTAGKLEATAQDSAAEDRTYGTSSKLTVGASAMITSELMATAGISREKYPEIASEPVVVPGGVTPGASTRSTTHVGAGLEYAGLHSGNRVYPFRLGFRSMQLPYAGADETPPKETSVSIGTGYALSTDSGLPQALFDVSLERTHRSGLVGTALTDGLTEKFWRMNISVSLFGR
jgi:hypothetical protein